MNRWDVNLSGLMMTPTYVPGTLPTVIAAAHTPSWVEWATAAGILAYGLSFFLMGARFLPIFGEQAGHDEEHEEEHEERGEPVTVPA